MALCSSKETSGLSALSDKKPSSTFLPESVPMGDMVIQKVFQLNKPCPALPGVLTPTLERRNLAELFGDLRFPKGDAQLGAPQEGCPKRCSPYAVFHQGRTPAGNGGLPGELQVGRRLQPPVLQAPWQSHWLLPRSLRIRPGRRHSPGRRASANVRRQRPRRGGCATVGRLPHRSASSHSRPA